MSNLTMHEGPSDETPCVAILGTCDTKLDELLYVRTQLLEVHHVRVKLVDVGRDPSTHPAVDIKQPSILALSSSCTPPHSGALLPDISTLSRNELITTLSKRAGPILASLAATHDIHAVIALGGSGGSALAAGVFRVLPLGFPKLLVSTMASGDVRPFVQDSDVAIMYSVVDIAGLNDILCPILENAAGAVAGMARAYQKRVREAHAPPPAPWMEAETETAGRRDQGKRIAITMFGVTTPAVTRARSLLASYDCTPYVFHATGAGGRAMERLISAGFFDGVLDLTTTELADELVGGVLTAGPHRLEAAARRGVPQIISLGALDMVNFGPMDTVPEKWKTQGRRLHEHNPSVTVMRTTPEECALLGKVIARKLKESGAKAERTELWLPCGGVSALSVSSGAFEDREADEALVRGLDEGLSGSDQNVRVVRRQEDINNAEFVKDAVESLVRMMGLESASCK